MMTLVAIRRRFIETPGLLKLFVIGGLIFGIGLPAIALIPGAGFRFHDQAMTWEQLWETRIALALLIAGLLMFIVGFGVLFRKRWTIILLVLLPILQAFPFLVVHWVYDAPTPIQHADRFVGESLLWALSAAAYLLAYHPAKQHFSDAI